MLEAFNKRRLEGSLVAWHEVVYLLSYYGLMLPAGYALAFPFGLGVRGVWLLRPQNSCNACFMWLDSLQLPSRVVHAQTGRGMPSASARLWQWECSAYFWCEAAFGSWREGSRPSSFDVFPRGRLARPPTALAAKEGPKASRVESSCSGQTSGSLEQDKRSGAALAGCFSHRLWLSGRAPEGYGLFLGEGGGLGQLSGVPCWGYCLRFFCLGGRAFGAWHV